MERRLATVLFVDIVGSTELVTSSDPEIVRRRVTRFFEEVSDCVSRHGGVVEKFAGDAVLAAFGVRQAHEDDAERAVRAGCAILDAVRALGLEARVGIEAGEVVVEEGADSTFATGEAVNRAARLQQHAAPGELVVGPGVLDLCGGLLETEPRGEVAARGFAVPFAARVVTGIRDGAPDRSRTGGLQAPLIGRESELELLASTLARAVRDDRAHLFTVFGEPGVGKSRLVREFTAALEGVTVLSGRCLPYGESITYWPLAEMVKVVAGISDSDPVEEAFAKLRACCEEEAVADLLGLAAGLLEAVESERRADEIAWAAQAFLDELACTQPLVLVFEDIHWAEDPLLDLLEHVADRVRGPLLVLALARPELLDVRPGWGGGRLRSTAIELPPLRADESTRLVEALLGPEEIPADVRAAVLDKTEGNPLFVEETVRMVVERGPDAARRIPDTLQALIAARLDRLPRSEKLVLQRAAVIGRIFWRGAVEQLAPEAAENLDRVLDDLLVRDLVVEEPRSTIAGERAYRFRHMMIREVAYGGLSKLARAGLHERFAGWLAERAGEELVEIRAYHLDQATLILAQLGEAVPAALAADAAAALTASGRRAMTRESYATARKLFLRAVEVEPTLERRYRGAKAAWRLGDYKALGVEMERVRTEAAETGDAVTEANANVALGEAKLWQDGDAAGAVALIDRALDLLEDESAPASQFDALLARAAVASTTGDLVGAIGRLEQAFAVAVAIGRRDRQTMAVQRLARVYIMRLELEPAERMLGRALEVADESGSDMARLTTRLSASWLARVKGELDTALAGYEAVRDRASELGLQGPLISALHGIGNALIDRGDLEGGVRPLREAVRLVRARDELSLLPDIQCALAEAVARLGRVDEAERLVDEAESLLSPHDWSAAVACLWGRAVVLAERGDVDGAEALLRAALARTRDGGYGLWELGTLRRLTALLAAAGRPDQELEERLAELAPRSTAPIA